MSSSKTFFSKSELPASHSIKNKKLEKFKYNSFHKTIYDLRNKVVIGLDKINFFVWKRPAINKAVDWVWEGTLIGSVIFLFRTNNSYLMGLSITIGLYVLFSYLEDLKRLFGGK